MINKSVIITFFVIILLLNVIFTLKVMFCAIKRSILNHKSKKQTNKNKNIIDKLNDNTKKNKLYEKDKEFLNNMKNKYRK